MTDFDTALRRLAALAGVAREYRDAWGNPTQIAPDTLHAVLAAMGMAVDGVGEIEDAIAAREAEEWRPLLPSAVVLVEGDAAAAVPLTVPHRLCGGRVLWSVALEDGARRNGAADFAALPVLAERAEGGDRRRRFALALGGDLPLGYHRLAMAVGDENAETSLIVAPRCGHVPGDIAEGARLWGLTAQLYGLRSAANWGMGDFGDLRRLAGIAAERGARLLGLNPLHALFPAAPESISPYSPSSRLFLNPLYIDVEAVPDLADCAPAKACLAEAEFKAMRAGARAADLVDYPAVAALKAPFFAMLHASFAERHLGAERGAARSARGADFRRFQKDGGWMLDAFAAFNALHSHFLRERSVFSWTEWPAALRDAKGEALRRFAAEHSAEVERHQYLQWEAERQLGAAAEDAAARQLRFYRDLAVGVDPNGAAAWAEPSMMVTSASIGAPPDVLNMKGQDWGLAPINPTALRRQGYAPFIAALRANMRHAGVLRIDHVMGLKHLYWVPRGAPAAAGTYVAYPFQDLLRILTLESRRHGCAVIGEDLGTVPEGFRETMHEAGVFSYRVMLFERGWQGELLAPQHYPPLATASFSTHDIATVEGFWLGRDVEWRRALDLYPTAAAREGETEGRRRDRRLLLEALQREGLLDSATARRLLPSDETPVYDPVLAEAVHRYLGRTASRLALMQMEDAIGTLEQANLPGTVHEHPNWRRKLSVALEALRGDAMFERQTAAIADERPDGGAPP